MKVVCANDAVIAITAIDKVCWKDGFFDSFILETIHVIHLRAIK